MSLLIHPQTQKLITEFISEPSHALLLSAAAGTGKLALAEFIARQLLQTDLDNYPYILHLEPEKDSIGIDAVRQIQHFLQLKTLGSGRIRRVIIIEDAHSLTTEAQNAILKLLEEPPADTVFILTTVHTRLLLPTVKSRLRQLAVTLPETGELKNFFKPLAPSAAILKQAIYMSGGLPGLLHALLTDDETHPLLQAVEQAKKLLQQPAFGRLTYIGVLSSQSSELPNLLEALRRIAHAGMEGAAAKRQNRQLQRWHTIHKAVYEAQTALEHNANVKLALSQLVLAW